MGILDFDMNKITQNPAFSLGMNILGNNQGYGGNTGMALGAGLQDFQRQNSLLAQQARAQAQAQRYEQEQKMRQEQWEQQQAQYQKQLAQQEANKAQISQYVAKNMPQYAKLPQKQQEALINASFKSKFPSQPSYGTSPHFDAQGNAYQLSSSGGSRKIGPQLQKPAHFINYGGGQIGVNPFTGQQSTPNYPTTLKPSETPQVQQQQAAAKKRGAMIAEGKAQSEIDWPQTKASANYTINLINKAKTHPGRKAGTGLSSMIPSRPGGDAYNFDVLMKQIKGKQFLSAFEQLKGAGQITEIEGQKATEAEARMDQAQSEDEFMDALNEYEDLILTLEKRASQRAGITGKPNKPVNNGGWSVEEIK